MPNLSKIFGRCLHKKTSDSFDTILAKYQCGFRKGHSAHHCVIALQEKCTESIGQGLEFGIPLTDHFKAFDYLPHNLFVCRSDDKTLQFIYDYLWHCKERTKIAGSYSSWQEILYGVPQEPFMRGYLSMV